MTSGWRSRGANSKIEEIMELAHEHPLTDIPGEDKVNALNTFEYDQSCGTGRGGNCWKLKASYKEPVSRIVFHSVMALECCLLTALSR